MIQNLLKVSFRLLWRERFFTLIHIAGLATGMAAAAFMFLWANDELTFDRFHARGTRIYRVLTGWKSGADIDWAPSTPAGLSTEARESVPGIDKLVRTRYLGEQCFVTGPNRILLDQVSIAEDGFFDVFDFPCLLGNAKTALTNPQNVILTESAARKIFGRMPEIGEPLQHLEKGDFQVGAILKDLPTNSTIQFDCLLPWATNVEKFAWNPKHVFDWGQVNFVTWALLRPEADPAAIARRFTAIASPFRPGGQAFNFSLQRLHDIHLYSPTKRSKGAGDLSVISAVGLIGLLVLLIACINYVNLTTARAAGRAKNVGIRQTIGAGKAQLFAQSMLESGLTILAATLLAGMIAWAALPYFARVGGKDFTAGQVFSLRTLAIFGGTALLAWVASGMQPAFQLTRFKPVAAMKGEVQGIGKASWSRQGLVVGQFVLSIGFCICSFLIFSQLKYVREANLGFDREHSFMVFARDDKAMLFKNELLQQPGVRSVTACDNAFVNLGVKVSDEDEWEGKQPGQPSEFWQINVDSDFPQFFNLQLADGRWFRPGDADSLSFVINESAAKAMQLQDPVGKWMKHGGVRGVIVGVARDFHFKSLHQRIEPMIFSQFANSYYVLNVKTGGAGPQQAIAATEKIFQKIYPDQLFKYEFLDEQYDQLYKTDARVGQITGLFTGLALFISCLGLLGLAAFAAVQRTKEVGIRKVLGASAGSILGLLSGDFLKLVLLALALASPLAWWIMQGWLADFAYRISIGWQVFALSGALAIVVAFLTVSSQALRVALANPVSALRSE